MESLGEEVLRHLVKDGYWRQQRHQPGSIVAFCPLNRDTRKIWWGFWAQDNRKSKFSFATPFLLSRHTWVLRAELNICFVLLVDSISGKRKGKVRARMKEVHFPCCRCRWENAVTCCLSNMLTYDKLSNMLTGSRSLSLSLSLALALHTSWLLFLHLRLLPFHSPFWFLLFVL